jgi:hypothetical protein
MGKSVFDPSPVELGLIGLALILATPDPYGTMGPPPQYPGIAYAGAGLIAVGVLYAGAKAVERRRPEF